MWLKSKIYYSARILFNLEKPDVIDNPEADYTLWNLETCAWILFNLDFILYEKISIEALGFYYISTSLM